MVSVAGVIIKNKEGEYLLPLRGKDAPTAKNQWGLFGGHMEGNESPIEAARRELKEELNLDFTQDRFIFLEMMTLEDADEGMVHQHLFSLLLELEEKIKLGKGEGYGFFTKKAIELLNLPQPMSDIAAKYF